jgi:hypothetical protein
MGPSCDEVEGTSCGGEQHPVMGLNKGKRCEVVECSCCERPEQLCECPEAVSVCLREKRVRLEFLKVSDAQSGHRTLLLRLALTITCDGRARRSRRLVHCDVRWLHDRQP